VDSGQLPRFSCSIVDTELWKLFLAKTWSVCHLERLVIRPSLALVVLFLGYLEYLFFMSMLATVLYTAVTLKIWSILILFQIVTLECAGAALCTPV
jgi:hypothetical protein